MDMTATATPYRSTKSTHLTAQFRQRGRRMAAKATSRSFQFLAARARPSCQCLKPSSAPASSIRHFSAASSSQEQDAPEQYETERETRPRWAHTPPRMKAPYATTIKDPDKAWEPNSDPARLDKFYVNFLGRGGENILTEEVKWLAITHKSFDQGRRGFNDRLAFLGMSS
jgi:large subunit ribosomal protein L15